MNQVYIQVSDNEWLFIICMQLRAIIQTFLTVCDCFLRALYWLYPTKEHILPKNVSAVDFFRLRIIYFDATYKVWKKNVLQ